MLLDVISTICGNLAWRGTVRLFICAPIDFPMEDT